jgi:hypothetical protein
VRVLEANRTGEDPPAEFDGLHSLYVHRYPFPSLKVAP